MFRASKVVMLAGLCAVAGLGAAAGSARAGTSFAISIGSGFGGHGSAHYAAARVYHHPVAYVPPVVYVRPISYGYSEYYGYSGYRGRHGYPAHHGYSGLHGGYSSYGGHSGFGFGVSVGSAQSAYVPVVEPVSTPDRPYYGAASGGGVQQFTSNFKSEPEVAEPMRADAVRAVAATQPSVWRAGTGMTPSRSSSDTVMRSLAQNASGRGEQAASLVSVQPVARVMPVASAAPVAPLRTLNTVAALPAKAAVAPLAHTPEAKPAPARAGVPVAKPGGATRYVAAK